MSRIFKGSWGRLILVLSGIIFLAPDLALADGQLDSAFVSSGVSRLPLIRGKVDYADGRFLLFGDFTHMNGQAVKSLARFNSNGTLDTSFNPPISGEVKAVVLLSNGKILVGGDIVVGNTYPYYYYRLARLNSDGSVDTTFYQTLDWFGSVNALAVQSDGKILVGGWSLTVQGDTSATYHLLRLNANGSVDNTYPKRSNPGGVVHKLKILENDACLVLGFLPNLSFDHHAYLAVLRNDGTVHTTLADWVVNGPILDYTLQGEGKIVLVGDFTYVYGESRNRIVRLNTSDLSLDTSFNPGSGFNDYAHSVLPLPDGELLVTGNFTSYNGVATGRLVRLSFTGGLLSANFANVDDYIQTLAYTGNNILLCGAFRQVNGASRQGIAALDFNGTLTSSFSSVTNQNNRKGIVYALLPLADGKLLVGGNFTGLGGKYHRALGRLQPNGSVDASFRRGVDGHVLTLAQQGDGKILLGGYFGSVDGHSRTSLARLNSDSSWDLAFQPLVIKGDGSASEINRVVALTNGQLMAAGHFQSVQSQPRSQVVRLNNNGTLDTSFTSQITINEGTGIKPYALVPTPDNKYVVVGYVTYQGLARGFLCRLLNSGALDTSFQPVSPSPHVVITAGEVRDVALQPDGKIVIVGNFTQIKDGSWFPPTRKFMARFSATGALENGFGEDGADNAIYCLARQSDGKFLLGGAFTKFNSTTNNVGRIARILPDGNLDTGFQALSGADDTVWTLALRPGGKRAVVGGQFASFHGAASNGLAQIITGTFAGAGLNLLLLD